MHRSIAHPALPKLKAKFSNTKYHVAEFRDMITVLVPAQNLLETTRFLRDDPGLRYNMLCDLNCVDYLHYPNAPHRFGVNYGLTSVPNNGRIWLKVYLDPENDTAPGTPGGMIRDEVAAEQGDPGLRLDSVTSIWPGAEWMEREIYDMFGIFFVGHPDLRRILTWNGFGSFPLRKDYPLRGVGEREKYKIITREGA